MDDDQIPNRIIETISCVVMYIWWFITKLTHLSQTGHALLALNQFF